MLTCLGFPFINKNTRSENSPTKKKILKHDKNKDRPYKFLNSNIRNRINGFNLYIRKIIKYCQNNDYFV